MFYQSGAGGVRPQCSRQPPGLERATEVTLAIPRIAISTEMSASIYRPKNWPLFQKGVSPELNIIALPAATFR